MNKFLKGFVCALLVLSTGCAKEEKKETPKKTKKKTEETAQVTHTDITMSFVGDMTLGNYAGRHMMDLLIRNMRNRVIILIIS